MLVWQCWNPCGGCQACKPTARGFECKLLLHNANPCLLSPDPTLCLLSSRPHPLSQVLVQAGAYVKDDACRALILLVVNAAQLHAYAARASYRALTANLAAAQPSLLMVATWCLGALMPSNSLPPCPAWCLVAELLLLACNVCMSPLLHLPAGCSCDLSQPC